MAWYSDSDTLRAFGKALVNAEVLEDGDDFLGFLSKPMQYKATYDTWSEAGYPEDESDDGWEEFVEAISSDDEDESNESE